MKNLKTTHQLKVENWLQKREKKRMEEKNKGEGLLHIWIVGGFLFIIFMGLCFAWSQAG